MAKTNNISLVALNRQGCDELAALLSSDRALHAYLSPNRPMCKLTGEEYYEGCLAWESRRGGHTFHILNGDLPIGSISYAPESEETASVGLWIASRKWNAGYGRQALRLLMKLVKDRGYLHLTASIQKSNPRSKRMFAACGASFTEDTSRWYAVLDL